MDRVDGVDDDGLSAFWNILRTDDSPDDLLDDLPDDLSDDLPDDLLDVLNVSGERIRVV